MKFYGLCKGLTSVINKISQISNNSENLPYIFTSIINTIKWNTNLYANLLNYIKNYVKIPIKSDAREIQAPGVDS